MIYAAATVVAVSNEKHHRVRNAVETKYGVHVDHVDGMRLNGDQETTWVLDGIEMKCTVWVDTDWTHVNPTLVCNGHEPPH